MKRVYASYVVAQMNFAEICTWKTMFEVKSSKIK